MNGTVNQYRMILAEMQQKFQKFILKKTNTTNNLNAIFEIKRIA